MAREKHNKISIHPEGKYRCPYTGINFNGSCQNSNCPAHSDRCGAVNEANCYHNGLNKPPEDYYDIGFICSKKSNLIKKIIRKQKRKLLRASNLYLTIEKLPKSKNHCINCGSEIPQGTVKCINITKCNERRVLLLELKNKFPFQGADFNEIWAYIKYVYINEHQNSSGKISIANGSAIKILEKLTQLIKV